MNKFLLSFVVCMFLGQANAQMPVTDVAHMTNQAFSWSEQLGRMASQLSLIQESEGYLNESINFYKKIHSKIKNSAMVFKILESQYKLIEIAYQALTLDNQEIGSEKIYTKYRSTIMEILEKNNVNAAQTADYIKDGIFKMNDAERLEAAQQLEKRTSELYTQIYSAKTHFEGVNRRALAIKKLED